MLGLASRVLGIPAAVRCVSAGKPGRTQLHMWRHLAVASADRTAEHIFDTGDQLAAIDWFLDQWEIRAVAACIIRTLNEGCHNDHRDRVRLIIQDSPQLQTTDPRHLEIRNNAVEFFCADHEQRVSGLKNHCPDTVRAKQAGNGGPDKLIVVDDRDGNIRAHGNPFRMHEMLIEL